MFFVVSSAIKYRIQDCLHSLVGGKLYTIKNIKKTIAKKWCKIHEAKACIFNAREETFVKIAKKGIQQDIN